MILFTRGLWLSIAFINIALSATAQKKRDYIPLIDPFIGTYGNGHTQPGPVLPYGMVQLNPETRINGGGYDFTDAYIYGFSHIRMPQPNGQANAQIIFMPTTGAPDFDYAHYRSGYTKKSEKASPGYYEAKLDKYDIGIELTATYRAALHKYDYPKTDSANVIIDLQQGPDAENTGIEVVNNHEVKGFRFVKTSTGYNRVYFYAVFSKDFKAYAINVDSSLIQGKNNAEGKNVKMCLQFNNPGELLVKVGLSHVSTAGALHNVYTEIPHFDFKKTKKQAEEIWNTELAKINVEGGAPPQPQTNNAFPSISDPYGTGRNNSPKTPDYAKIKQVSFYTAFYHTMLTPNIATDVDGQYRDGELISVAKDFNYYNIEGLLSPFGVHYQLLTLTDHARTADFIKSYLVNPAPDSLFTFIPFIADASIKGIKGFNPDSTYNILLDLLNKSNSVTAYKQNGYIPANAATTLAFARNFYCMAQMAKALNKQQDYTEFKHYSQFWKNVYNHKTDRIQARENGGWKPLNDDEQQYSFLVPFDVQTLVDYAGGKDAFEAKLDAFFTGGAPLTAGSKDIGYYHDTGRAGIIPYLYNYTNAPQKSQVFINGIIKLFYQNSPGGINGNDSHGETSAWYVLSCTGLYNLAAARPQMHIGFPQFEKTEINFPGGKKFTITNPGAALSLKNIYIQGMNLAQSPYNKLYINYDTIATGGQFEIFTGTMPNKLFMQDLEKPIINNSDSAFVPKPYVTIQNWRAEIGCAQADAKIYYTTNGSVPTAASTLYNKPFTVNNNIIIKAVAVKNGIISMVEETLVKK